jgi:hypothetical protein
MEPDLVAWGVHRHVIDFHPDDAETWSGPTAPSPIPEQIPEHIPELIPELVPE